MQKDCCRRSLDCVVRPLGVEVGGLEVNDYLLGGHTGHQLPLLRDQRYDG